MIHPTAIVETESIGAGTRIWAYAHVLRGARIGQNVNVGDHAFIEGGAIVGDNVTLKNNVCVWDGVTIESGAFVGPGVIFTNDRHPRSPRLPQAQQRYETPANWLAPTTVRYGCSIGAGAVILPGIELGPYAMIAAGSVVIASVPAFQLVAGNPARRIADVCTCGRALSATFDTSRCDHCGQTAVERQQALEAQLNPVSR